MTRVMVCSTHQQSIIWSNWWKPWLHGDNVTGSRKLTGQIWYSTGQMRKSYKHQIILMKVYYSAGLRKLAKHSGYHGTTLKSVEQCSNFKWTNSLLQTWEAKYQEMLHVYITNTRTTITKDASCILLSDKFEYTAPTIFRFGGALINYITSMIWLNRFTPSVLHNS